MARYYVIAVGQTLFGEISLTRRWGRIGTRGREKTMTFASADAAARQFEAIKRRKLRRGYRPAP